MQSSNDPARRTTFARRGFTLVEMLVVVVIIAILAGMTLGAVAKSREQGRREKTNATIAKLDTVLNRLYEKYRLRRLPLVFSGMRPVDAARLRCDAIRDTMRMELPQCFADITKAPLVNGLPAPSAQTRYSKLLTAAGGDHQQAKCLYMIVMNAGADARSQFTADEIQLNTNGDPNGDSSGMPCFIDGWGNPIGFLRWAPGYSPWSDIQMADPLQHHDPFDPLVTYPQAYQLYPLVFAGVIGKNSDGTDNYGINLPAASATATNNPFADPTIGAVTSGVPFTNHHMEMK